MGKSPNWLILFYPTDIKDLNRNDTEVEIYWNVSTHVTEPREKIVDILVYNLAGQQIEVNSGLSLGVYVVQIKTMEDSWNFKKKLLN